MNLKLAYKKYKYRKFLYLGKICLDMKTPKNFRVYCNKGKKITLFEKNDGKDIFIAWLKVNGLYHVFYNLHCKSANTEWRYFHHPIYLFFDYHVYSFFAERELERIRNTVSRFSCPKDYENYYKLNHKWNEFLQEINKTY